MGIVVIQGSDTKADSRTTINDNFAYLAGFIGSSAVYGSGSVTFPSIAPGTWADRTFTVTGAVPGRPISPGLPATLEAGLLPSMWCSAPNTITVRILNMTGAAITPAVQTFSAVAVQGTLEGSASIIAGAIAPGNSIDLTFALPGAVAGRPVSPGWPSTLEDGLLPVAMWVSATDVIKMRILNMTGSPITPAPQTYYAAIQ